MRDFIDRQAAIDLMQTALEDDWEPDYATDRINELPSAQPERKTGKWICSDDLYETAICSCCGWDTTEPWDHIRSWFRYCPRCGARLVQEGEDNDG